ncbi:MAG: 30S ribosomal protein S8 [Parachlamydiales bacterium]|jgi:small subunit ribosomal protein S8
MTFNDPIAELLTKIRNASAAQRRYVDIWVSKEKLAILKILKEQGFIENFITGEVKRTIRVFLKYNRERQPIIQGLKRISSPGSRIYARKDKLPWIWKGLGVAIVSTSKGIMDDKNARQMGLGGELLCYVW